MKITTLIILLIVAYLVYKYVLNKSPAGRPRRRPASRQSVAEPVYK